MSQSNNLFKKILCKYESENELIRGEPFLELYGNNRVFVENHRGIIGYSCEEVYVRVEKGVLLICGEKLCIAKMTKSILVILGEIKSVSCCGGKIL